MNFIWKLFRIAERAHHTGLIFSIFSTIRKQPLKTRPQYMPQNPKFSKNENNSSRYSRKEQEWKPLAKSDLGYVISLSFRLKSFSSGYAHW